MNSIGNKISKYGKEFELLALDVIYNVYKGGDSSIGGITRYLKCGYGLASKIYSLCIKDLKSEINKEVIVDLFPDFEESNMKTIHKENIERISSIDGIFDSINEAMSHVCDEVKDSVLLGLNKNIIGYYDGVIKNVRGFKVNDLLDFDETKDNILVMFGFKDNSLNLAPLVSKICIDLVFKYGPCKPIRFIDTNLEPNECAVIVLATRK